MNIKSYINIVENMITHTASLRDLYDEYELDDQSEALYNYATDEILDHQFTVHIMQPDIAKKLLDIKGETPILKAFNKFATKNQKQIVKGKMQIFDYIRIVVLDGNKIIDGNHHIIAAILAKKPIRYIDLSEV